MKVLGGPYKIAGRLSKTTEHGLVYIINHGVMFDTISIFERNVGISLEKSDFYIGTKRCHIEVDSFEQAQKVIYACKLMNFEAYYFDNNGEMILRSIDD